jgi:hypothetical protein
LELGKGAKKGSSSSGSGGMSDAVPPASVNKYSSKQAVKEAFQSTSELVKDVGKKVMGGNVGSSSRGKSHNDKAVDMKKIKELGEELMKKDEDFNQ